MSITRLQVGKRLSQAVIAGDTVYLAGQVSERGEANVAEQTRQVLAKIDRLLAEAGSDKTRLLSVTIYLADAAHFEAMNTMWEAWMPPGCAPARTTIQALLPNPAYLVEIQVIAAR